VNHSILLLALLGLIATRMAHAQTPSVCASMCEAEQEQCSIRAHKLAQFDTSSSMEEKNPFARTANRAGRVGNESTRVTERYAAQMRARERLNACNAGYQRCTGACAPAVAPAAEEASPGKETNMAGCSSPSIQ
jgi:hypothetical protein